LTAEWKSALRQQFRNLVLLAFLTAMAMQRKGTEKEEGADHEDDSKEDYDDEFEDGEAHEGAR
jgi:hypothetical protein